MRQITEDAVAAFMAGRAFRRDNTEVEVTKKSVILYLHGSPIARKTGSRVEVSTAGWKTNTTKERLNGVLSAFDRPMQSNYARIWQRRGQWHMTAPATGWRPVEIEADGNDWHVVSYGSDLERLAQVGKAK